MVTLSIDLWDDIGYQEESVTVPAVDATLPAYQHHYDNLHPPTSELFSRTIVDEDYSDLMNSSYLRAVYTFGDGTVKTFYGWVDSVELKADTDKLREGTYVTSSVTVINWHIDLWRSFIKEAELGYGIVTRRVRGAIDPPQTCSYRYRKLSTASSDLIPGTFIGSGLLWGIVNCTTESSDNKKTEFHTLVSPISRTGGAVYFQAGPSTTKYRGMTLSDWVNGLFDEQLGLAPTSIASAFVSTLPPYRLFSGSGTEDDPYILSGSESSTSHTETKDGSVGYHYFKKYDEKYIVLGDDSKQDNASGLYQADWLTTIDGETPEYVTPTTVIPADEFVKLTFGEDVFSKLNAGDTVRFSNVYGIYSSAETKYTYTFITASASWLRILSATITGNENTDTLTFDGSTFGTHYVYVHGEASTASLALTTTASTVSSDDFVMVGSGTYIKAFYRKDAKTTAYEFSLTTSASTSDTEELVVLDYNSLPVATLPWGLTVKDYTARTVLTSSSAYIQFRFDSVSSASEGLEVTIPLPALDVTSNSYSEYVFSGQREYDVEQRKLSAQQSLYSGVLSSFTGGASNAVIASLNPRTTTTDTTTTRAGYTNSWNIRGPRNSLIQKGTRTYDPQTSHTLSTTTSGTRLGAMGAFGLSAGVGVAASIAQYGLDLYMNDKLQSNEDMLQAKQIDSIITSGNGWDFLYHGIRIRLASLKPDSYSVSRFNSSISLNGIECCEPTEDCTSYIFQYTGPVQIQDLVVHGDIPVEAKMYIKSRYAEGIRIL